MKRGWKAFWIICGAVFCLGAVFCIAGRMMGTSVTEAASELDGRFRFLPGFVFFDSDDTDDDMEMMSRINDNREYGYGERAGEPGYEKSHSGIRKIDVEAAGIQLQVLASPDADVHVEGVNIDKRLRFKCVQNREELKITTTKKLHTINQIDGYATIWLLLPKEQLEELDLSNDAGEVYVAAADAADFTLDVGAGSAVVDSFTAGEVDLECGAGQISAKGSILTAGALECGIGQIVLELGGKESDYVYDVECGIGEVTIAGYSHSGIGISKSDVDDDYDDYDEDDYDEDEDDDYKEAGQRGKKELSIECGIGSVSVDFTKQ